MNFEDPEVWNAVTDKEKGKQLKSSYLTHPNL